MELVHQWAARSFCFASLFMRVHARRDIHDATPILNILPQRRHGNASCRGIDLAGRSSSDKLFEKMPFMMRT